MEYQYNENGDRVAAIPDKKAALTQHTPGPWSCDYDDIWEYSNGKEFLPIISPDIKKLTHKSVANICPTYDEDMDEHRISEIDKANARLIAAAPELLEALEMARKVIDELMPGIHNLACDIGVINNGCVAMNRAIAKARGK